MWPLVPLPGESLLGWITRTAHENVLPSPYTMMRRAGLGYTDKPVVALLRTDVGPMLAQLLGAEIGEVARRMLRPTSDPGFVQLSGASVRLNGLATNSRRFSPAALSRTGTHLSTDMIRALPFSTSSWEYLQDTCANCGSVQRWRHAHSMRSCDACCGDLTLQPAEQVEPGLRTELEEIAALVGEKGAARDAALASLAEPLRDLDAGEALELTLAVAAMVDPSLSVRFSARLRSSEQRRLASAMASAWTLLRSYPTSLEQMLLDASSRRGEVDQRLVRERIATTLRGVTRVSHLPRVERALSLASTGYTTRENGIPPENMLVKPAARALGVTESEVADAREKGVLIKRIGWRNGRMLANLDKSEIENLAGIRQTLVAPFSIGKSLGLPLYGAEQLLASGVIDTHDHPWLLHRHASPQATVATLDKLVRSLRLSGSTSRPDEWIALSLAMRAIGGGPKPWAAVIGRMLNGDLPYFLVGQRVAPTQLFISKLEARRLRKLGFGQGSAGYTQVDALEILNLNIKQVAALSVLPGKREKGKGWRLDREELESAASRFVSRGELMARTGANMATIGKHIREHELGKPGPLGWSRTDAERKLADLLR